MKAQRMNPESVVIGADEVAILHLRGPIDGLRSHKFTTARRLADFLRRNDLTLWWQEGEHSGPRVHRGSETEPTRATAFGQLVKEFMPALAARADGFWNR